jgi:hypothetical protein
VKDGGAGRSIMVIEMRIQYSIEEIDEQSRGSSRRCRSVMPTLKRNFVAYDTAAPFHAFHDRPILDHEKCRKRKADVVTHSYCVIVCKHTEYREYNIII